MCLISFIVPVYNLTEEEVSTCISSIAAQTIADFEIIIVDDGSNNGIGSYCDCIGRQYGASVIHQQNMGLAGARNAGIKIAKGEWVVHVDGDDWVESTIVESVRDLNSYDDIIVWGFSIEEGHKWKKLLLKNKNAFEGEFEHFKERILCAVLDNDESFRSLALNTSWGKAYNKRFIDQNELYYDLSLRRAQDAIYNLYAFTRAHSISYIDKALNFYRTNNNSLSRGYNPKTYDYLYLTALAAKQYLSEENVAPCVEEAVTNFVARCFRMINEQMYQHRNNPHSFCERRRMFMLSISQEPFHSAFLHMGRRPGCVNQITDFLYKYKLFGLIGLFNNLILLLRKLKHAVL